MSKLSSVGGIARRRPLIAELVLAVAFLAASCGGSTDLSPVDNEDSSACMGGDDRSCVGLDSCDGEQSCDDGEWSACQCEDAGDGDDGGASGDGDVVPSAGGTDPVGLGGSETGGDGGGGGSACEYTEVSNTKEPVVLLLLDQSGTMREPRWSEARSSVEKIAAGLEPFAQVGLIGFPLHPVSSDLVYEESCGAGLKVEPGRSNASKIVDSIHPEAPSVGHTPIRAALNLAADEFGRAIYDGQQKFVILITDGAPNCASSAVGSFWVPEDPSDAVEVLSQNGVTTFVLGYELSDQVELGGFIPSQVADNMARAGGTEIHRDVTGEMRLDEELNTILDEIFPCSFDLAQAPVNGPTHVRVTVGDVDYPFQDEWKLEGEKTIVLEEDGAACEALRDGGSLKIQVECEPIVLPLRSSGISSDVIQ